MPTMKVKIYPYVMPFIYLVMGIIFVIGMVFIAIRAGIILFLETDLDYWIDVYFDGWLGGMIVFLFVVFVVISIF